MRFNEQLEIAMSKKIEELKALEKTRRRMEERSFAVEKGEDGTFWKSGFTTNRSVVTKGSEVISVLRRREVG